MFKSSYRSVVAFDRCDQVFFLLHSWGGQFSDIVKYSMWDSMDAFKVCYRFSGLKDGSIHQKTLEEVTPFLNSLFPFPLLSLIAFAAEAY